MPIPRIICDAFSAFLEVFVLSWSKDFFKHHCTQFCFCYELSNKLSHSTFRHIGAASKLIVPHGSASRIHKKNQLDRQDTILSLQNWQYPTFRTRNWPRLTHNWDMRLFFRHLWITLPPASSHTSKPLFFHMESEQNHASWKTISNSWHRISKFKRWNSCTSKIVLSIFIYGVF